MSSETLTLPSLTEINTRREPIWEVTVLPSQSGKEQRVTRQSAIRYRWTISTTLKSADFTTLTSFISARSGTLDDFYFTCPFDSTQRKVRFESLPEIERVAVGFYECSITLISLL